ncbi:tail-specific protease Tsp [Candidatus Clavichlamydia salmonicola]|uniref:tail-specific protease Tsp n=1 Tax=Candidatus Clavichlamydia salmonicola TaxID=469812 RepID=UPI00189124A2|nr:S41 family peptidase [Candidatus Clavichlamydia salmonicola]
MSFFKNCFYFLLFSFFCLSPVNLHSGFSEKDIPLLMKQLLDAHVDTKEINEIILERSLHNYAKQFDRCKIYLSAEEVKQTIQIPTFNNKLLKAKYEKRDFSDYFLLDLTLSRAIYRAQSWREEWLKNPLALFEKVKNTKDNLFNSDLITWSPEITLKERHQDYFIHLISLYLQEFKEEADTAIIQKLCTLSHRHLLMQEEIFLGSTDDRSNLKKSRNRTVFHIMKSLAQSLDAHTACYSKEEALSLKIHLEKGLCGIGVALKESVYGMIIQEVLQGSPADLSGLINKGDRIYSVDGVPTHNLLFSEVIEKLRGPEGSSITLGINDIKDPTNIRYISLIRQNFDIIEKRILVSQEPFADGIIGKISLFSFYENTHGISSEEDIRNAIIELQKQNLLGLVLDMRENTGGFLSQAIKVSGLFMSSGVVAISRYADGLLHPHRILNDTQTYHGPLIILISKSSASATEIVAQTLQDYGIGIVVGDKHSYGKGTIQHQTITNPLQPLQFKVTVGRYYTVSGKSTQINGVSPDIIIPSCYAEIPLGERYLEYPLAADSCPPAFEDSLADLEPDLRHKVQKYYVNFAQKKEVFWHQLLPILQKNSKERQDKNTNFQLFLKNLKQPVQDKIYGSNDLQMEESVNIIKDMIVLKNYPATSL